MSYSSPVHYTLAETLFKMISVYASVTYDRIFFAHEKKLRQKNSVVASDNYAYSSSERPYFLLKRSIRPSACANF